MLHAILLHARYFRGRELIKHHARGPYRPDRSKTADGIEPKGEIGNRTKRERKKGRERKGRRHTAGG
jgi:hypothetical protein